MKTSKEPMGWKPSILWLVLAVACFQAAYTSIKHPAAGLFILGYALALVRLTDQPNVRRAFYFGLATGFLCYAPQLWFFTRIFSVGAGLLWLVLAFWIGLFSAMVCGAARCWGRAKAMWLIPIIWTGLEFFRSELYPLKFSWLNIGYAWPSGNSFFGMYGCGLVVFTITVFGPAAFDYFFKKMKLIQLLASLAGTAIIAAMLLPVHPDRPRPELNLVGIQMEFPPENLIPRLLNQALAKNPNAPIFVLSEYTLEGGVPDSLKTWCLDHARFLVVGGKDYVTNDVYYNTAFVVGTNGDIVFKQVKSVPIQFFRDGLPAPEQKVWNSPWGKIGICVCYDLSYTRVTDELVRQGAQLLIVPTMDLEFWGRHQHELHARVAPVRAAEYGLPIFRVASSGISQAVRPNGQIVAQTTIPGYGDIFATTLPLPQRGSLPLDRWLAPVCTGGTSLILAALLWLTWKEKRTQPGGV